jgi:hypothetical protein
VVRSRELSRLGLVALVPLVAVIVALGAYPNFVTSRTERATVSKLRGAQFFAGKGVIVLPYAETVARRAGP